MKRAVLLFGWTLIMSMVIGCRDQEVKVQPEAASKTITDAETEPAVEEPASIKAGELELSPATQHIKAKVGTKEVEFVYTAFNNGSEPIRITEVDSGCACIAESVEPELIQPGEAARITAVYSTEKLNGLAEKVLAITTDQANVREAFLTVKLEMDPIYQIDKDLTTWKKGKEAETKIVNFEVTRDDPIRVLSAKSSRPEIATELVVVEKGRKYQIHLTPVSTGANLLGMVRLETDCEIEAHARPLLYVTIQ